MFLRTIKPVIVALGTIINFTSRGRLLKRNCSFVGLLCQREFCTSRVYQSIMENESPSKTGSALVAVCQMNSTSDVDRNLGICKDLVRKAKSRGAKVVFLPECFDYVGENCEQALSMAAPLESTRMQGLCDLAKELGVWLSLGGYHEKGPPDDKRLYNSHVMVDDHGSIATVYRKIHLFDINVKDGPQLKESDGTIPGDQIVPPVSTPVGNVGLAIVRSKRVRDEDLGVMVYLTRADIGLGGQGEIKYGLKWLQSVPLRADIRSHLSGPSAIQPLAARKESLAPFFLPFRDAGENSYVQKKVFLSDTSLRQTAKVLLRCRAIENQCYVIAAAQTGQHNPKRRSYGHAMIVDPWGCAIAQCGEGNDVCIAEIDLDYLSKVRQQMPVMKHKRNDLYGKLNSSPKL